MNFKKIKKTHGFTLIELLIVVAIIAILAAAIIISITPGERIEQAREATREAHQQAIGTAFHITMMDNAYATTGPLFANTDCVDTGSVTSTCATDLGLPSAPEPPGAAGTFYTVSSTAAGTRIIVNCTACTARTY